MKRYVIIVAGGSGSRMQNDLPKQFLLLDKKPVLMHTMEAFANASVGAELILVLNVDYHTYWEELAKKYSFNIPHKLVKGGTTRFHSVKNGLKEVGKNALIAIHDAVRPIITKEIINQAFEQAESLGNAVVAVKAKDSIRRQVGTRTESVKREGCYLVQTPQVFHSDLLMKAFNQEYRNEFTDDASVVESLGEMIHLLEGNYNNIKITFPEDIIIAEALIKSSVKD